MIATPETIEEGDKARAQAAIDIASGKLLREPDGYYSFPVVLGTMFTGTGKMEILGYTPDMVHGANVPRCPIAKLPACDG